MAEIIGGGRNDHEHEPRERKEPPEKVLYVRERESSCPEHLYEQPEEKDVQKSEGAKFLGDRAEMDMRRVPSHPDDVKMPQGQEKNYPPYDRRERDERRKYLVSRPRFDATKDVGIALCPWDYREAFCFSEKKRGDVMRQFVQDRAREIEDQFNEEPNPHRLFYHVGGVMLSAGRSEDRQHYAIINTVSF